MADPSPVEIIISELRHPCPIEIEGTINGQPFYFRARGSRWRLYVGGHDLIGAPNWYYEEAYGQHPYEAGWMDPQEAKRFLQQAAAQYVQGFPSRPLA